MAVTIDELRLRLGIPTGSDDIINAVITDTMQALSVLTGLRTFRSDYDFFLYQACMDVYKDCGYGQSSSTANAPIQTIKDKDQSITYATPSTVTVSSSAMDVLQSKHAAVIKRLRKLRWN
jgi:hypothetical protein